MTIFAVSSFIASFLILLDQKITIGTYFEINQILHHEFFAMFFLALGIGIIIGATFFAIIERI